MYVYFTIYTYHSTSIWNTITQTNQLLTANIKILDSTSLICIETRNTLNGETQTSISVFPLILNPFYIEWDLPATNTYFCICIFVLWPICLGFLVSSYAFLMDSLYFLWSQNTQLILVLSMVSLLVKFCLVFFSQQSLSDV